MLVAYKCRQNIFNQQISFLPGKFEKKILLNVAKKK